MGMRIQQGGRGNGRGTVKEERGEGGEWEGSMGKRDFKEL